MKKIIVTDKFWDLFPDAQIGVVIAKDINNEDSDESKYRKMLDDATKIAYNSLDHDIQFSDNEVIQQWRQHYKSLRLRKVLVLLLKLLLKRINKGDQIPTINPLVDIYNSISLKYQVPCGAEDIDKISGNMELTTANGDEEFITYGSDQSEPPYPGEVIYKDDKGAICRCLNWREGVRTIIDENSKNAELCIETLSKQDNDKLVSALKELTELIKTNLGGTVTYKVLTKEDPEVEM